MTRADVLTSSFSSCAAVLPTGCYTTTPEASLRPQSMLSDAPGSYWLPFPFGYKVSTSNTKQPQVSLPSSDLSREAPRVTSCERSPLWPAQPLLPPALPVLSRSSAFSSVRPSRLSSPPPPTPKYSVCAQAWDQASRVRTLRGEAKVWALPGFYHLFLSHFIFKSQGRLGVTGRAGKCWQICSHILETGANATPSFLPGGEGPVAPWAGAGFL